MMPPDRLECIPLLGRVMGEKFILAHGELCM